MQVASPGHEAEQAPFGAVFQVLAVKCCEPKLSAAVLGSGLCGEEITSKSHRCCNHKNHPCIVVFRKGSLAPVGSPNAGGVP